MRKFLLPILGLILLSGCGTASVSEMHSKSELKYKKILVMPFTKGEGVDVVMTKDTFISELLLFSDIEVVGKGEMDETAVKNLGVTHAESFGALDFSSTPEGDERRNRVLDRFNADAIIFGYTYSDQGLLSLNVQMMDASNGEVILSFSKDASIPEGFMDDTARDLARKSAHKVTELLKDNVIITNFHRR